MIFIRKFYDAAVADAGAAPETETAPLSMAAMMAKGGMKTENSPTVYTKETKENENQDNGNQEKPKEETKIAATATSETEKGKPEPKEQPKAQEEAAKPIAQEQPKAPTLEDVLKTVQPKAVLKAMGMDDDEIAILDELKGYEKKQYFSQLIKNIKEGKGNEYLKEWTTDYNKMLPEDVMRHQLQKDYPKANAAQLNALYKKEVIEKYNLNSEDEDEKNEGLMLLEAQADRHRDNFVENQKNYLTPKAIEPKQEVVVDNTEQQRAQDFEVYKKSVTDNPLTKDLFDKRILTVGEGDDKLVLNITKDLGIEPSDITDILFDSDKWAQSFFTIEKDSSGKEIMIPDVEKQLFMGAAAKDLPGLLRNISKYYKAIGGKAAIEPIDNAKPKDGDNSAKSQKQPQTLAEAMAKGGKVVG
jgi:hypothetical protein